MSQAEIASRPHALPTFVGSIRRWLLPTLLAVLITVAGVVSVSALQQSVRKNLNSKLTTILETDVKALTIWTDEQKRSVYYLAQRPELRSAIGTLIDSPELSSDSPFDDVSTAIASINAVCQGASQTFGYVAYRIFDRDGRILADSDRSGDGARIDDHWLPLLELLNRGETIFVKPSKHLLSTAVVRNDGVAQNESVAPRPLLFVAAPIRGIEGKPIAAISFGIPPEREFTEILSVARAGESGETFAFDQDGWLLSDSRFDDQLQQLGLLEDGPDASAVLNIRSQTANGELTEFVASAIEAKQNSDFGVTVELSGTPDYRGVKVVGASQWLPQYDFGVVTKLDYDEAYAPSLLLRNIVSALLSLSLIGFIANVLYARRLARVQKRALQAERRVRQLGQYTLQSKIGEGGMGEVYRAKHAMLRRPTAVKLLRADRSSEAAIARFEQEVQMTAMLTHPNTIAIYDYGRTPDGTFYYAMEYLDGLDLSRVVKLDGPQSAGRVIEILRQVCHSLSEAHEAGLIHRDIKPANVILSRRGSRADIVKVLDFGLVRDLSASSENERDKSLAGTPAYMSPESFHSPGDVDARSDVYAVGALGYFLVTGTNAVEIDKSAILSRRFTAAWPLPSPSQRLGRPVDLELSNVLMSCLQIKPEDRPQSAAELASMLIACEAASQWTNQDSIQWWEKIVRLATDVNRHDHVDAGVHADTLDGLTTDLQPED